MTTVAWLYTGGGVGGWGVLAKLVNILLDCLPEIDSNLGHNGKQVRTLCLGYVTVGTIGWHLYEGPFTGRQRKRPVTTTCKHDLQA